MRANFSRSGLKRHNGEARARRPKRKGPKNKHGREKTSSGSSPIKGSKRTTTATPLAAGKNADIPKTPQPAPTINIAALLVEAAHDGPAQSQELLAAMRAGADAQGFN